MSTETKLEYFGSIKTSDEIKSTVSAAKGDVKKYVDQSLQRYTIINVSEAMEKLSNVSGLLKLANAASKSFPSNKPIIKILGTYQTMINDTAMTTASFVQNCIKALGFYEDAIMFCEEGVFDSGFEELGKTAKIAEEMAKKCAELVEKADELVKLALEALTTASEDEAKETEKLKAAIKEMDKLNAEAERLKTEIEGLNEQITEMKELGDQAAKDAREDRKMANIMRIVGAIAEPLASMAGSAIAAYTGVPPVGRVKNLINENKTGKSEDDQLKDDPKDDAATKVTKKQKRLKKQEEEKEDELEKKETEEKELEKKEEQGTITDDEKKKKETLKKEISTLKEDLKTLGKNISNVANEIATEYKESAAKAADKELEYRKLKNQYQDLKRKANSDLAADLATLKSLDLEKSGLKVGIQSLNIVINAMGKVKTIFENTRIFWKSVQDHCESLASLSSIESKRKLVEKVKKDSLRVKLINEIKISGCSWLALASINQTAFESVKGIKNKTDDIMNNLPNTEQAKAIVKETTDELEQQVKAENDEIDAVKKKIEEENKASKPTA